MQKKKTILLIIVLVSAIFAASATAQMYELVMDNTDPEHQQYGIWIEVRLSGVHGNNTVHAKDPASGSYYFRYLCPTGGEMAPGQYNIYARWATHPALATNTRYTVYPDGISSIDVRVNQKVDHARWVLLGTFDISHPRPVVRVYDDADGFVEADGLRYVRVGDLSTELLDSDIEKGYEADEIE